MQLPAPPEASRHLRLTAAIVSANDALPPDVDDRAGRDARVAIRVQPPAATPESATPAVPVRWSMRDDGTPARAAARARRGARG